MAQRHNGTKAQWSTNEKKFPSLDGWGWVSGKVKQRNIII